MNTDNIKENILNKFYKKRVHYFDDSGDQREKQISKSEAKDLAEAVEMLDPTDNKKYFNALDKTYLNEGSDLFSWIISAYYVNDNKAKGSLKELRKSIKKFDSNKHLFDEYHKNFNNFNSLVEFVDTVDEVLMGEESKKSEEESMNKKNVELKNKKKELNFLKGTSVVDGKIYLGDIDIYSNNFLNIFELNEIKRFSKKSDFDYQQYFSDNEVSIDPETLNTYIKSITTDDKNFMILAYDIIKASSGLYSIIDIEEEINEKSINTITDLESFIEQISVESIFQYFSEFIPDIYEFFELSIIAGAHNKILQKINDLFKKINSSGIHKDERLKCIFVVKVGEPFKYKIHVHPKSTQRIYDMDRNGELNESIISLDDSESPSLKAYVAHNYLLQSQDEYNALLQVIQEFNDGTIKEIEYKYSSDFIKTKIPELKKEFTN